MRLRERYRCRIPVFILTLLLFTGLIMQAQESLLDREIHLSQPSGQIDQLLKEIARKGKFSFTYTSQIQSQRYASVMHKKQPVKDHLADIFRYDSIQVLEQNKKILLIPLLKKPKAVTHVRSIKGVVIDGKTRQPLPYSSIFLSNKSTGTITNQIGRFELKVHEADYGDTLGISHIGYRMVIIPLSSVDTSTLIIRLSSEKLQIREVVVKPLDPIYILTKAIERISDNYDCRPAVYTGFIRESTQQDNKNVSLSEAIINVFKEPYASMRDDQIKIFKGRKGNNLVAKELVDFVVQGSLYNSLQLDIVKNRPTFLDADYFALYEYNLEKTISHLERPTYVIDFRQREGVRYPCYKGKVYVDVETLAIAGAFFELSDKEMSYTEGVYVKKTPRRIGVKPLRASYQVFYRLYHNKWNLSNVRSELLIRVRRKKDKEMNKFNSVFTSVSEFVITNKDTANVTRFKADEISRPRDVLVEQIGETDLTFWGDENIIIPEEPIEKAIIKFNRKSNLFSDQEIRSIKIEEEKESDLNREQESKQNEHDENVKKDEN
ncbi:MAG: carboxypeptidase-like regulatory domain-containing protein [Bacteroidales bacterium]